MNDAVTLTEAERDSLTLCECGHYLNEHSSDGCLATDYTEFWRPIRGDQCICGHTPNAIRRHAIEAIIEARVSAAVAERDQQWRRRLGALPAEMAEAWGGDAAWLTTGSKVASLIHEWLSDLTEEGECHD